MSQPTLKPSFQVYCGIDIAAQTFSAALLVPDGTPQPLPGKAHDFSQTKADYAKFSQLLRQAGSQPQAVLVVMEATGTYWLQLALYLTQANFVVSVINPAQTGNFARSLKLKVKNDQIDAQILARLAYTHQPSAWTPPPHLYHELQQRLVHSDTLVEMKTMLTNQLKALRYDPNAVAAVLEQKEQLVATLQQQIKEVEKQLVSLVADQQGEWSQSIGLLQTIPGIGLQTACWIVCATMNFSNCSSSESLVQYAELAPIERSSVSSVRKHPMLGHGGNGRLRKAMYIAAWSAIKCNLAITAYCERLRSNKRKGKEICCAVGRKLLQISYGVVKSQQAFDPQWHTLSRAEQQARKTKQAELAQPSEKVEKAS